MLRLLIFLNSAKVSVFLSSWFWHAALTRCVTLIIDEILPRLWRCQLRGCQNSVTRDVLNNANIWQWRIQKLTALLKDQLKHRGHSCGCLEQNSISTKSDHGLTIYIDNLQLSGSDHRQQSSRTLLYSTSPGGHLQNFTQILPRSERTSITRREIALHRRSSQNAS